MTTTMPAGVAAARDLVGPAVLGWLDRLSPDVRIVAAYHLGFVDSSGTPTGEAQGGKALRPALALLSARAAGAAPERGVTAAAAVEFVHNFSLLHDDIMDGDALLCLAQDMLITDPSPQGVWAARCLSAAVHRLIAGQGADLAFERRD